VDKLSFSCSGHGGSNEDLALVVSRT